MLLASAALPTTATGDDFVHTYLPVVTAIVVALLAFLGAFVGRFVLDKRQEFIQAQAYARVIQEELRGIERRIGDAMERQALWAPTQPLSTRAWLDHRAAVAAQITLHEYMALTTFYYMVGSVNSLVDAAYAERGGARLARRLLRRPPPVVISDELVQELGYTRIAARTLALPSITWLAESESVKIRRRRARAVLSPPPQAICRCGHPFDHHRWDFHARRLRIRLRGYALVERAHECNVVACSCRQFLLDDGASFGRRTARRLWLVPQASYLSTDLDQEGRGRGYDSSIPHTAHPGAQVEIDGLIRRVTLAVPPPDYDLSEGPYVEQWNQADLDFGNDEG